VAGRAVTYDEQIRDAMIKGPEWDAETLIDTIPDGTLKINGRFVRVEPSTRLPYPEGSTSQTLYRIVDDSDA
jgi:hypothetical protein